MVLRISLVVSILLANYVSAQDFSIEKHLNLELGEVWQFTFTDTGVERSPREVHRLNESTLDFLDAFYFLSQDGLSFGDSEDHPYLDYTPDFITFLPNTLGSGQTYTYTAEAIIIDTPFYGIEGGVQSLSGSVVNHGYEKLTVPAGTFDAIKIVETLNSSTIYDTPIASDGIISDDFYSTFTYWFSDEHGLVKNSHAYSARSNLDNGDFIEGTPRYLVYERLTLDFLLIGLWADTVDTGNGWRFLDGFGSFQADSLSSGWIFHQYLGFVYAVGSKPDSIWMWSIPMGWFWTSVEDVYPSVYSTTHQEWMFFSEDNNGFFAAGSGLWVPNE